jgi:DNA-binding MarR family transcriptional regulator
MPVRSTLHDLRSRRTGAGELAPGEATMFSMRALFGTSRRNLEAVGLTVPQAWLLSVIALWGPLKPSDLARRSHVSRQAVASALRNLQRRGLVARTPSETDRREISIEVTPTAERLFQEMLPRAHELHVRIDRLFDASERKLLVDFLGRIAGEFESAEEMAILRCPLCHPVRHRPRSSR